MNPKNRPLNEIKLTHVGFQLPSPSATPCPLTLPQVTIHANPLADAQLVAR